MLDGEALRSGESAIETPRRWLDRRHSLVDCSHTQHQCHCVRRSLAELHDRLSPLRVPFAVVVAASEDRGEDKNEEHLAQEYAVGTDPKRFVDEWKESGE